MNLHRPLLQPTRALALSLVLLWAGIPSAHGEQPIFDEMPRWSGGWGIQLMQEYLDRENRNSESNASAPSSKEHIHLTHLQGVYTWDKSIRVTVKVPVVVFAEKVLDGNPAQAGGIQRDQGLGDPTSPSP